MAIEKIPLYMDDMLEEKEMQEVVVHLLVCNECKRIHNDLSQISQKLKDIDPVSIPDSFHWEIPVDDRKNKVGESVETEKQLVNDNKKRKALSWRTFSAIAAVLVISIALSSEMIDFGTVPAEEPDNMVSMARMETHDEEILWKDIKNIEDEENYYIKQIQNQLGQDIQIETSNKDAEEKWHFTIRVNEILYKYEGKGGEIWIVE